MAALLVLTLINLLNYLDRYVVSSLVESLKKSPLQITDAQAGLLMTGFVVVYMLASPLFGYLGDRGSRTKLLFIGVGIWSLATVLAGFAQSFFFLFLARAAVGIGEAAYGTIAPALLADSYPVEKRGRVFSIFYSAIPIGAALGYVVGGYVDQHWGWRSAFFISGAPGIVLAFFCLKILDPGRVKEAGEVKLSYFSLLKNKPYVQTVLGYAAYTFAVGGLAFWMPSFLERSRGFSKSSATMSFGGIVLITGFLGTFAGGFVGDKLLTKIKNSYLWVSSVSTLVAVPFAWVALTTLHVPLLYVTVFMAQLFLFFSTGPINSAIANQVPSQLRTMAFALSTLSIHLLGDVPSPPLIGFVSDRSSLGQAVLMIPFVIGIAGMIWLAAARKPATTNR